MKTKTFLLTIAATLALAACSKEDIGAEPGGNPGTQGGEIRFEIGFAPQDGAVQTAPQTRVATNALFFSTWEDGDAIGIFAVTHGTQLAAAGNPIHNVKLTYSSTDGGKWTTDEPLYWPAGDAKTEFDFYAYYPYDANGGSPETLDPTAIAFNVQTDQSGTTTVGGTERSNYNLSDLLTAKSIGPVTSLGGWTRGETVHLFFAHTLAMVQVVLTADRAHNIGPVGGDIAVTLHGVKTGAAVNLGRIVVAGPGGGITLPTTGNNATSIKMYRAADTDNGEPVFRALVPAQTVEDGYRFSLTQFNELYEYAPAAAGTLTAAQAEIHGAKMPFMPTVRISKGTFLMGSLKKDDEARNNEKPQHSVTLTKDFRMGRYQVTAAQYAAFLNAVGVAKADAGSKARHTVDGYDKQDLFEVNQRGLTPKWNDATGRWESDGNTPMINVTWFGAKAYADWVGGSLPTEAQWEYACRAGTTTAYSSGDDAASLGDYAWYYDNTQSSSVPFPVGTKKPNPWGLYDMHGNVWEWCSDWYSETYYRDPSAGTDPTGPEGPGETRVLRGAAWFYNPQFCRSAYRNLTYPHNADITYGFRVVFNQ